MMLIDDLLSRRDNIKEAMDNGSFIFLVCGGYQLFGQYYIAADGSKIKGLQFFDYFTETGENGTRCIAVSYTHLDVYKRQDLYTCAE